MEFAEAALHSDPDWIFITTWNDWWEHTHSEPSEQFGDECLHITREFGHRWKGRYDTRAVHSSQARDCSAVEDNSTQQP